MIGYEQIENANKAITKTTLTHKDKAGRETSSDYVEVNQRIKAFRMLYPEGFIHTVLMSNDDGVCIFLASVGYWDESGEERILATGTAYETEGSTFINKTSYIENCETSAVGRALGMLGLGIDTSVASYEEVSNAIANQPGERKASPKQIEVLKKYYVGANMEKLLKAYNIEKIEDMPMKNASGLISKIKEKEGK